MTNTYHLICERGFANEYTVGIATTDEARMAYDACGFERIKRKHALKELSNQGDAATKIYACVTINGRDVNASRLEVARELRQGGELPLNAWGVR